MWLGIFAAHVVPCDRHRLRRTFKALSWRGTSYFFAEQAFLSKKQAFKWARLCKFVVGWASHLYYWVYPGVMVGVTALLVGYIVGQIWPTTFVAGYPSPIFMFGFAFIFAFGVAYIAFRGVGGTTGVNAAINVIQISALVVFSIMAIGHRSSHPEGSKAWVLDSTGTLTNLCRTRCWIRARPSLIPRTHQADSRSCRHDPKGDKKRFLRHGSHLRRR